jgi:hypothetical protein
MTRPGQTTSATATTPSSVPSDGPPRRDWQSSMHKYICKSSGEVASDTAPSSLGPWDAPTTAWCGFGLGEFQGKFSSSTTDDQEPDEHYSEPGAVWMVETSERTSKDTGGAEGVPELPPVPPVPPPVPPEPEIHQSQESSTIFVGSNCQKERETHVIIISPLPATKMGSHQCLSKSKLCNVPLRRQLWVSWKNKDRAPPDKGGDTRLPSVPPMKTPYFHRLPKVKAESHRS